MLILADTVQSCLKRLTLGDTVITRPVKNFEV